VRWEQPRPSQNLAFSKGQQGKGATPFGEYLQRHLPLADEIEGVGLFTLMENELSSLKADVGGTPHDEFEMALWKVIEKRMLTQNSF
jgi:hypothetical protein